MPVGAIGAILAGMTNTPEPIHDVVFATYPGKQLRLDLYFPPATPQPYTPIVNISGGGWRNCSKNSPPLWLVEAGFAVASIEYRVSGEAIAPANIQDCKAAIRWVRANAAKYHLNAAHIGAFGGSAGGHLAALLAVSSDVPALEGIGGNANVSSTVQAACDFCGPSDLTRIARPEIRAAFALLYEVTEKYLGGPVEARTDLAHLVSPLHYVGRPAAPLLICHGEADTVVPVAESIVLYDAMKKVGADVILRTLPGAGHGWDAALTSADVIAFFRRTLQPRR